MDILEFFLIVLLGYTIGKVHAYFQIAQILRDMAETVGIDIEKELQKKKQTVESDNNIVHRLKVEAHGDMLYLFEKETDTFICQGSSVQELAKLAKEYKNIGLAAVMYGDKVFKFKDGTSQEFTG